MPHEELPGNANDSAPSPETTTEPSENPLGGNRNPDRKPAEKEVPIPTLERLTTYLRCLIDMGATGLDTVSSSQIEQQTGISAAQFRKDLSWFGEFGKPGVGYNVTDLEGRIAEILQINRVQPILLIGAGNLGSALVGYPGLEEHKFRIVAAFDADINKVGRRLRGIEVYDFRRLHEINRTLGARICILAVPAVAAQSAAEHAIESGVRAILNFAPIILRLPGNVIVRNVSFLQELAVLSYHLTESSRAEHR
ncbi:MAG: redox-sensing transcriptional repressor Rex [Capsulimonadales bacterium]|nr:redox-sensing transcriptional repressor Rex [Capsulimonadales bacterium]